MNRPPPASTEGPTRDQLVPIYAGLTPLAEMLREALAEQGIASVVRLAEPDLGLLAEVVVPSREQVLISAQDYQARADQVEECLVLVAEAPNAIPPEEQVLIEADRPADAADRGTVGEQVEEGMEG
ncbi:MAG: hypothetical protein HY320_10440 [Armatimonadetes bacterium]|nr:hypothetical protein [Armatimonadota bacterium]